MSPNNVFINCPFDDIYFPILKSILFTLTYIDLEPKISESSDSGEVRFRRIKDMMCCSEYSIHDISRMDPLKKADLPRFNMPFECGVDFGLKLSNRHIYANKKFLILEKEKYRYQKVISDIAGNDIKAHQNDPELAIKAIRDWFKLLKGNIPYYKEIWLAFNEFEYDYEQILLEDGYNPKDINELTFKDVIEKMKVWISEYKRNFNSL